MKEFIRTRREMLSDQLEYRELLFQRVKRDLGATAVIARPDPDRSIIVQPS